MLMRKCSVCGYMHLTQTPFCLVCGAILPPSDAAHETARLDRREVIAAQQARSLIDRTKPLINNRQGWLRFELIEAKGVVTIPIKESILLGRPDPVSNSQPDIDFTPMAGYRMGVSRQHAKIHWYHDNTLILYDLGSSNGTFVNGERLEINQPKTVYNGDIIGLGQLGLYIYYEVLQLPTGDLIVPLRPESPES